MLHTNNYNNILSEILYQWNFISDVWREKKYIQTLSLRHIDRELVSERPLYQKVSFPKTENTIYET